MTHDTDSMPLERRPRSKYLQFDPTLNSGHILQVLVIVGGFAGIWGQMSAERATQRLETEQIKREAANEAVRTKEAITELKTDVRKVGDTLQEVNLKLERLSAQVGGKEHSR